MELQKRPYADIFAPQWPEGLEERFHYEVKCDDNPAAGLGIAIVEGDAFLSCHEAMMGDIATTFRVAGIRIRNHFGGGRHLRTHQALLWLALAIKLDNEDLKR